MFRDLRLGMKAIYYDSIRLSFIVRFKLYSGINYWKCCKDVNKKKNDNRPIDCLPWENWFISRYAFHRKYDYNLFEFCLTFRWYILYVHTLYKNKFMLTKRFQHRQGTATCMHSWSKSRNSDLGPSVPLRICVLCTVHIPFTATLKTLASKLAQNLKVHVRWLVLRMDKPRMHRKLTKSFLSKPKKFTFSLINRKLWRVKR